MTFEEFAMCGDVGLAEDLLQDVLIKFHRNWARVEQMDARAVVDRDAHRFTPAHY